MAQKRTGRLRIQAMPWRKGLATAGQQTTIEETSLWRAENVVAELDGLLGKRPGLRRWGQILMAPNLSDATSGFFEPWTDLTNWTTDDASSGLVVVEELQGSIRTSVAPGTSNETLSLSRQVSTSSTTFSIRVALRIIGAPTYDDTTNANTLAIRISGNNDGTRKEFALFSDGLYYKQASDNKYAKISGTEDLVNTGWHVLEIRCDTAGTTSVLLDESVVSGSGISNTLLADVGGSTTDVVQLVWEVDGAAGVQYSTEVASLQYIDTNSTPFVAKNVRAVTDFNYITLAGSSQPVLVAAAGDYIYHDAGLQGIWRVLLAADYGSTSFAPYRRTLLIIDHDENLNSNVWQWTGNDPPEVLDDAPAIKFATEHKQRVWAAGDRTNPLRLYYSGDRQPNLWFSPGPDNIESQVDAAEQAGYLEIPAKKGDRITAAYGDYYGRLLVFTRRGVWQVSGDGPASFSLASVSQEVGTENNETVAQVGNDIWFLGRYGVQALSATDQFGDIQSGFPSAPIGDLWSQTPSAVKKVIRSLLVKSRLKYNPTQGLVYCAVPLTGEDTPESVFVYNANVQQWYGPWSIESQAMENIEVGLPLIEVMAHGGSDGQVLYTDQSSRRDVEAGYTMTLQSAYLNGRSVDPQLAGMMKTWKKLRLFLLPRGNWNFDVTWRVDNEKARETVTLNQNQYEIHALGNEEGDGTGEFRLSVDPDGRLHSREEMAVIETSLDVRGYSLRFTIEQAGAGEDLVIQGFEVEFQADGYEEE